MGDAHSHPQLPAPPRSLGRGCRRPDSGLIRDRSAFNRGAGLLGSFAIVLVLMVSPVFPQVATDCSMPTTSSTRCPKVRLISRGTNRRSPPAWSDATSAFHCSPAATRPPRPGLACGRRPERLAEPIGNSVRVNADLGNVLLAALADSSRVYLNDDSVAFGSHQLDGRETMYAWYRSLKEVEKALTGVGRFDEGRKVNLLVYRSVEPAFNYYGVPISRVSENAALSAQCSSSMSSTRSGTAPGCSSSSRA